MLTPHHVLNNYFLDTRCMLIEIAAMLDRHDRAVEQHGSPEEDDRLDQIYQALTLLAERETTSNRGERLLQLFSEMD